jgi:hypothetical protein
MKKKILILLKVFDDESEIYTPIIYPGKYHQASNKYLLY